MPSQSHALLVDFFRASPSLALDLLRARGVDVAATSLRILDSTFPVTSPDYHVDLAVACDGENGEAALVVLIEVQLEEDEQKLRSWPLYHAAARARFKCPACVLVVTIDERVAAWAREPVSLGPCGSTFRAVVLGPAAVPRAASPATPELAVLSALAHGGDEPDTVQLALASISGIEPERAAAYSDFLRYHLGAAFERALEAIMTTTEHKYLSDWARNIYDKGKAEGEAVGRTAGEADATREALLTVISARGLELDADELARIHACTDAAALRAWHARAVHVATASEIFAD